MGSGFESQGAHFKENPADSSESAGFLRSLNFIDFGLRYRYFPLLRCSMLGRRYSPSFLQGTRPRFASDTLMSLRAIPSFLAWLPDGAVGNIYASVYLWLRGSRNPAGVVVDVRWFSVCAPCLANWGGEGCRLFGLLLGGWCFACGVGEGCRGLACCLAAGCFRLVRRVFRKRPQGVTRTLSAAKRGRAERPGDGCPCVGAEETCGVAASTRKQRVIAFQSVTPVRASPNTAVN